MSKNMSNSEIVLQAASAVENILPQKSKDRYEKAYQIFMEWITTGSPTATRGKNLKSTAEEIKKLLQEAPDRKFLFMKIALIIGISGTCRKQELKNMKTSDLEDSNGKTLITRISDTKNKIPRSFIVSGIFYNICKKYMEMRNAVKGTSISEFFLNYQNGKLTRQVVGINKLGVVPKKIAEYLKLPDAASDTGHCFRRTSATILVDAGGDLMALKRLGGWKSSTVAEGYVDESTVNKRATSERILQSINNNLPSTSFINNDI